MGEQVIQEIAKEQDPGRCVDRLMQALMEAKKVDPSKPEQKLAARAIMESARKSTVEVGFDRVLERIDAMMEADNVRILNDFEAFTGAVAREVSNTRADIRELERNENMVRPDNVHTVGTRFDNRLGLLASYDSTEKQDLNKELRDPESRLNILRKARGVVEAWKILE